MLTGCRGMSAFRGPSGQLRTSASILLLEGTKSHHRRLAMLASKDIDPGRGRMSQAELYRSYAEACMRAAQNAANDAERARWVAMAQHWFEWAEEELKSKPNSTAE